MPTPRLLSPYSTEQHAVLEDAEFDGIPAPTGPATLKDAQKRAAIAGLVSAGLLEIVDARWRLSVQGERALATLRRQSIIAGRKGAA